MADLGGYFDPNEVDTDIGDFEPLEPGEYAAEVIDSKMQDTNGKNGPGKMLVLTWRIIEGPRENARIWQNITWENPKEESVRTGHAHFALICNAVGLTTHLNDSSDVHGLPARIKVYMGKPSNGYPARPQVSGKGVKPYSPQAPAGKPQTTAAPRTAPAATRPAPGRTAAAPSGVTKPWTKPARAPVDDEIPF
jgi:hypothetical protein